MKSRHEHNSSQYVEVFTIWAHLSSNHEFIVANQFFCNHTENRVLKKIIADFTQCLKDENRHLERLLQVKGILLTPVAANSNTIPFEGNRTDTNISAALSMNIAASLVTTSKALAQAISNDTVTMYVHFHMKKAVLGAKLLQLSKDNHWL